MTNRVVLTCSACRLEMQIVADGVPHATEVRCSRCGHSLGLWHDLTRAEPTPETEAPADRAPSRGVHHLAVNDRAYEPEAAGLAAAPGDTRALMM